MPLVSSVRVRVRVKVRVRVSVVRSAIVVPCP